MPPIVNSAIPPTQNSSGVLNSIEPSQSVPIQLKILIPVGHGDQERADHREDEDDERRRRREHVVHPDEQPRNAIIIVEAAIAL
jgi:hypothetical protein